MRHKKLKVILIIVVILAALSLATTKYQEYTLMHSTYGPNWNPERIRRQMPLIEEDMQPGEHYSELTNRWGTDTYPTEHKKLVHSWKKVLVSGGHSFQEIDAFRYFVNDTIYYQLNITSEILTDSALISGELGWKSAADYKENHMPWQQLTHRQTDSVKRVWGIK